MDNSKIDPSSEIKPITELDNVQGAPPQEKIQNSPVPPATNIPPTPATNTPPSLESLAAEPLPGEEQTPLQTTPPTLAPKPEPQIKVAQTPPTAPPPPPDYVPPRAPAPPPGYAPPREKISVALPQGGIGQGAVIQRGAGRIWTIIIILVLALLLLAGTFLLFFYRATININPTPAADTITLDGKQISPGKVKVMPGPHTLSVKKTGYISLNLNRNFKINQKLDLGNLTLEKAITPEVVASGGTYPVLSGNGLQVNFTSSDGHLETFPIQRQGKTYAVTPLSVGTYTTIRELIYGQDNGFAFVLDAQALKVIDFKKTNLVDQLEAILPPDPSKIHSFSTNDLQSDSFGPPNSQIVYDFKTDTDWFLYLADSEHKQSQILMQIDPKVFTSMSVDWGQNTRQILLLGGTAGIYDLPTRSFERISDQMGFVSGSWGPEAQYAVAVKSDGELYVLRNSTLEDTNISVQNNTLTWVSINEVVAQTDGGTVKINFDTGSVINYAEIAGLQNSSFIAVSGNTIFFSDAEGLKTATLQENFYGV